LHPTEPAAADHDHVSVLGEVDEGGDRGTRNCPMLNGNITYARDGMSHNAHRIVDDLLGAAVALRQVVLRHRDSDPRLHL
jgi:hypothetical protein